MKKNLIKQFNKTIKPIKLLDENTDYQKAYFQGREIEISKDLLRYDLSNIEKHLHFRDLRSMKRAFSLIDQLLKLKKN